MISRDVLKLATTASSNVYNERYRGPKQLAFCLIKLLGVYFSFSFFHSSTRPFEPFVQTAACGRPTRRPAEASLKAGPWPLHCQWPAEEPLTGCRYWLPLLAATTGCHYWLPLLAATGIGHPAFQPPVGWLPLPQNLSNTHVQVYVIPLHRLWTVYLTTGISRYEWAKKPVAHL